MQHYPKTIARDLALTCDERDRPAYDEWKKTELSGSERMRAGHGDVALGGKEQKPRTVSELSILEKSDTSQRPNGGAASEKQAVTKTDLASSSRTPGFAMECFRDAARYLAGDRYPDEYGKPWATGMVRAAITDFLFHYKMSQQYPHEFFPYEPECPIL